MAKQIANFDRYLPDILEDGENALSPIARQALYELYLEHRSLCEKTAALDRQLATWLGLVPQQTGTAGRVRLGPISKRGDTYLRMLLIHGARCYALGEQTQRPTKSLGGPTS